MLMMMQEQEVVEDLDLHQDLLLEQHAEICRRRVMRRRIWKNLRKQISSLILGMFCTQRRDPEFILEELAETSSHCIPDLIDQAQGAGGEDEEKEKRKKKERKNRKKEEKKEGEAKQQKKKAHEGDETLLLSVL